MQRLWKRLFASRKSPARPARLVAANPSVAAAVDAVPACDASALSAIHDRFHRYVLGLPGSESLKASAAARIDGYGEVLDAASLIGDAGRLASTRAAARTANAEEQRLSALYNGGAEASLRAVESAQAAEKTEPMRIPISFAAIGSSAVARMALPNLL